MKKLLATKGYKVISETKKSHSLVAICTDKNVYVSAFYGRTKFLALLKAVRHFNSKLLPEFRPF